MEKYKSYLKFDPREKAPLPESDPVITKILGDVDSDASRMSDSEPEIEGKTARKTARVWGLVAVQTIRLVRKTTVLRQNLITGRRK